MEKTLKFYLFDQNNSGGNFDTDDKLCHRLLIEASSSEEATEIAEQLGCYWNGVDEGIDCECCGDRWRRCPEDVDLDEINTEWGGYGVREYLHKNEDEENAMEKLKKVYSGFTWLEEPKAEYKYTIPAIRGKVLVDTIENYAQVLANLYGWTMPDCRIFYKDGTVKEIFSNNLI